MTKSRREKGRNWQRIKRTCDGITQEIKEEKTKYRTTEMNTFTKFFKVLKVPLRALGLLYMPWGPYKGVEAPTVAFFSVWVRSRSQQRDNSPLLRRNTAVHRVIIWPVPCLGIARFMVCNSSASELLGAFNKILNSFDGAQLSGRAAGESWMSSCPFKVLGPGVLERLQGGIFEVPIILPRPPFRFSFRIPSGFPQDSLGIP